MKSFLIVFAVVLVSGFAYLYLESGRVAPVAGENTSLAAKVRDQLSPGADYDAYPYIEIVNPSGFINTEPLQLADLVGKKVVLLQFTTYSCINCQRTYPYILDWYETYAEQGLEVVFIHTPEFAYERDIENVRVAMQKEGVTFPVVLDNDKETWRAYENHHWPHTYLIDVNGDVVYDHIGEGAYDRTENMIQSLLTERAKKLQTEE